MPPAARTGDPTNHGGTIALPTGPAAQAVMRVLIGGKPAAVATSPAGGVGISYFFVFYFFVLHRLLCPTRTTSPHPPPPTPPPPGGAGPARPPPPPGR